MWANNNNNNECLCIAPFRPIGLLKALYKHYYPGQPERSRGISTSQEVYTCCCNYKALASTYPQYLSLSIARYPFNPLVRWGYKSKLIFFPKEKTPLKSWIEPRTFRLGSCHSQPTGPRRLQMHQCVTCGRGGRGGKLGWKMRREHTFRQLIVLSSCTPACGQWNQTLPSVLSKLLNILS